MQIAYTSANVTLISGPKAKFQYTSESKNRSKKLSRKMKLEKSAEA